MIILQSIGGDASLTFDGSSLIGDSGFNVQATTFRDNAYIHRLNRTLQAEMRAVSAYRSAQARASAPLEQSTSADLDAFLAEHQEAGKELVRLIILSRGIPEDRSILTLGLSKAVIEVCARVPSKLFARATLSTLSQLERSLAAQYERLLQEAPARDKAVIRQLRDAVDRRRNALK